ncbi:MAG TPA: SIS domain-containing protein [Thermoplasmata archaeon]|nr:SIS domain-containing protein [Thermoplasmata archaeon]
MAGPATDGPHRMRALAAALPSALVDGFHLGREISLPAESGPVHVFVAGMGGSGIAAELARGIVEAETRVPLLVLRSPTTPPSLSPHSRVILASYSGNTWETLRAYEAAGRAGSFRVVIASGGALAENAVRDRVPLLPIPTGIPPRSAVGHLLGGILGLLDPWFPESNEDRVRRIAEAARPYVAACGRARGPADRIAASIGTRFPFVYAESSFVGLARRWKTQIEENAKRLAAFDEIPELFHNALVGWDAIPTADARRAAVVLLQWAGSPPLVRQSVGYLETLLRTRRVEVISVPLESEDRLEALIHGLTLGDHVSLFLAERGGVDPYPVDAITRLKTALGTLTPGREPAKRSETSRRSSSTGPGPRRARARTR